MGGVHSGTGGVYPTPTPPFTGVGEEIIPNLQIPVGIPTPVLTIGVCMCVCFSSNLCYNVCMPRINIWISKPDLKEIDEKRGKMPRSSFLVRGVLGGESGDVLQKDKPPKMANGAHPYVPFYEKKKR